MTGFYNRHLPYTIDHRICVFWLVMDAEVEVQSFAHAMLTYIGKHNLCMTADDGVLQTTPAHAVRKRC